MAILSVCTYRRSGASIRIQRAGAFGVPQGIRRCYESRQDGVNGLVSPAPRDDPAIWKVRSFPDEGRVRHPGRDGARVDGDVATADREKPGTRRPHARPLLKRYAGRRSTGALPDYEAPVRALECPIGTRHACLHGHVVPDATALRLLLGYP